MTKPILDFISAQINPGARESNTKKKKKNEKKENQTRLDFQGLASLLMYCSASFYMNGASPGELMFHCVGGKCSLSGLQSANFNSAKQLLVSAQR